MPDPAPEIREQQLRSLFQLVLGVLDRLEEICERQAAELVRLEEICERQAAEREAFQEFFVQFFSLEDRRRLEQAIHQHLDDRERRKRRGKRFPHPGGFDAKKVFQDE